MRAMADARQSKSRVLDLGADVLSNPSRLDLALIEAQMIWPDDPFWKERALAASSVEFMREQTISRTQDELSLMFELARKSFPIEHIKDEVKKDRFLRGFISGSVLHRIISMIMLNVDDITMNKVIEDCIAPFKKTKSGGMAKLSISTFNNEIWPVFRGVSHYWAASIKVAKSEGNEAFPCTIESLGKFLSDAEAYRLLGERLRTKKYSKTVLKSEWMVRLPAELSIEPSHFAIARG
jgi:hypothetical protein